MRRVSEPLIRSDGCVRRKRGLASVLTAAVIVISVMMPASSRCEPSSKDRVAELIKQLKDGNWIVRESAVEALGEIRDGRAVEPLVKTLKDADDDVREGAAEALGKIKDRRAVEPLIEALKDEDDDVRRAAAEALGRIGDGRAVGALENVLRKGGKAVVRIWAAYALVRINKNEKAFQYLLTRLKDKDPDIRRLVAYALGEIGDGRAVEPLIEALKDESWHVCWSVA